MDEKEPDKVETGMCPHRNFLSTCQTCSQFAEGKISEQEIKNAWDNPEEALFDKRIKRRTEGRLENLDFEVKPLAVSDLESLLENLKSTWAEVDNESIRQTLENFFQQRETGKPALLNVEYYVAKDKQNGNVFAITGLYSIDVQGGAGLATKDKLDTEKHNLAVGGAWTALSREYSDTSAGAVMINWISKLMRSRGAKVIFAETDDSEREAKAAEIYSKSGLEKNFKVKDFFGPDRDLYTYYTNLDVKPEVAAYTPKEIITEQNRTELLDLAKQIYGPDRHQEFEVCLDLVLKYKEGDKVILPPRTFIERGEDGKVVNFAIMSPHIYENTMMGYWYGAKPGDPTAEQNLMLAMQGMSKSENRSVLILNSEGRNGKLRSFGFEEAGKEGIPEVYVKGDKTRFLFFSKKIN